MRRITRKIGFDYEGKVWGSSNVRLSYSFLGYLKLKYVLEDIAGVNGRILDVGCGGGGFAKGIRVYRPDLEVYGVDINKNAIKKANVNSKGVHFKIGDIYNKAHEVNLPTTDADLDINYQADEITDVGTSDDQRVIQKGQVAGYILHQWKKLS